MWKWTDGSHIKAIILDADSLHPKFLGYSYEEVIENVRVYKVKDFWKLDAAASKDIFAYFDITSLLQQVLTQEKCASYSLIAISSNASFLKEMMQNHIGTILVGELTKDSLKNTPDFTATSIALIKGILTNERKGYGAEVFASYGKACKTMSLLKYRRTLSLKNGEEKMLTLYFGGRYYAYGHQYVLDDPLSIVVKEFKENYVKVVDLFYESAIAFIQKRETVDILTSIPMKPIDMEVKRFDRFASLQLPQITNSGLKRQDILICKKNFSQKGNDVFNRKEIVKGAFKVEERVAGKSIILMDDVYSSGSTFLEAAKMLYESGAKNVIGIFLAVNQLTESSSVSYQKLTCPHCEHPMSLRINHRNQQMFFGCTAYQTHSSLDSTIPLQKGLHQLKDINKLEIAEIIDLNDEY